MSPNWTMSLTKLKMFFFPSSLFKVRVFASFTICLEERRGIYGMDWKWFFKESFIHSPVWKFNRNEWNGYEVMFIPFNPLPSIPHKRERNTHSFNEMEVIYHFYSNFEKKQINGKWYNSKIIYFFHFKSPFYKFSNTLKKKTSCSIAFYFII